MATVITKEYILNRIDQLLKNTFAPPKSLDLYNLLVDLVNYTSDNFTDPDFGSLAYQDKVKQDQIDTGTLPIGFTPVTNGTGSITFVPIPGFPSATPNSVYITDNAGVPSSEIKQNGFNLAIGTTAGTVAEGNHTHTVSQLTDYVASTDAIVDGKINAYNNLAINTFSQLGHTHTVAEITDFNTAGTALINSLIGSQINDAIIVHENKADPHPLYLLRSDKELYQEKNIELITNYSLVPFNNMNTGTTGDFWGGINGRRACRLVDLQGFTELKLDVLCGNTGFVGSTLGLGYLVHTGVYPVVISTNSTLFTKLDPSTRVPLDLTTPNIYSTGWISIPANARVNDVIWGVFGFGGNGTSDPSVGYVRVNFR